MANVIAVIWDCDKTLIDGYMQDPIFKEYKIDSAAFWRQVDAVQSKLVNEYQIRVNTDTYYLNQFIKCAHDGTFPGLSNAKLRKYGEQQKFYPGIPEFFRFTKESLLDEKEYSEYGIQVEHYIVSTGFAEVIRGSALMPFVDGIWGCELIDAPDESGNPAISEIVYTIDNTTKTRAIFEINKGIGKIDGIEVNSKIPRELRRVQFENMIYIADGPSDVPAFSILNYNGGSTFAVYPKGDVKAFRQVDALRRDNRVQMFGEADYETASQSWLWLTEKVRAIADSIVERKQAAIRNSAGAPPTHLN